MGLKELLITVENNEYRCVCSTESGRSQPGVDVMELGERHSHSAPSVYTRRTSVDSRLYPNKQLQGPSSAWNVGRIPRPHFDSFIFDVGSSAVSATDDNLDHCGEFFCEATENSRVRRPGGSLRTRTGNARSVFGQDRHEAGNFGDGFLPALQEDDGIPEEGIPHVQLDDISLNSIGQPGFGQLGETPAARTFRTEDASRSTAATNARDFTVNWIDVDSVRSRQPTVESFPRSSSQEETAVSTEPWRIANVGRSNNVVQSADVYSTSRAGPRLMSQLNFDEDFTSSSTSSAVGLHRSSDDHDHTWSSFALNGYFNSPVNSHFDTLRSLFAPTHASCSRLIGL